MSDEKWYENSHVSESLKTERWPYTKIDIFNTVVTYIDAHYFMKRSKKSLIRPISLAAEETVSPPWLHFNRRSFTNIFMAELIISLDYGWSLIRY